jgi:F-box-like
LTDGWLVDWCCTVEELRTLEEKPRYDPIECLPEEVSEAILKHAVVRESHGLSFISIEMVLLLTLVSSKWRRFIEATPSFWSDITLDDEIEDLAMKVTISLFFSREAYLVVQLVDPLSRWSEIGSIVLPHTGRIRSIHWVAAVSVMFIRGIFNFPIEQLWTPQLRSINIISDFGTIGDGDNIFLSGQSGHLHSVTGTTLTREVFRLPSVRSLRELATHEDARRVLAEALPHIETVEFLEKFHTDKESLPLAMGTLSWTSLTYRQGVMETLTSLLSRLPLLHDLILTIRYDDLLQLISSMRDLKSLYSLNLTLWNAPNKIFVPPAAIEPLYQVRTFIFRERWYGGLSEVEWAKLSQLPNAFFSLIPNVEFLQIQSNTNPMAYTLTSAAGFHKVHTLFLRLAGTSVSALGDFKFSESVRNLDSDFKGAIDSISRGIERLRVVELDLHNAGSQCGTVQRLHFTRFEGPSNNLQPFVTLTSIHIGGDEAVTRFCAIIATSPDTCPALHTLSFRRFPDLDILFIMLERRNLYSHSARARIKKLELPSRMPLSNFKTVRDLLRGCIAERQSNFEASLQSNIDMFLDLDM